MARFRRFGARASVLGVFAYTYVCVEIVCKAGRVIWIGHSQFDCRGQGYSSRLSFSSYQMRFKKLYNADIERNCF